MPQVLILDRFSPHQLLSLFSRLNSVLSGELINQIQVSEELGKLSLIPRSLDFALTVRDNAVGGGGVVSATSTVNVIDSGGAFAVTSQDIGNIYIAESARTVTWDVSGTDEAPISTSNVDISMSVGGQTYPYLLAESVPNSGSYELLCLMSLPTLRESKYLQSTMFTMQ